MACRYDGTVRNSAGDVVQFLYGEDGMDGVRIEGQVRLIACRMVVRGSCRSSSVPCLQVTCTLHKAGWCEACFLAQQL